MAKIIHTADIHLDSAFTMLPPDAAKQRREVLRALISKIVDTANDEQVDAIIIAGDLFDVYPIHKETEEGIIKDFARAQMPIFITPGNHDPYTSDSPYRTLKFPENVYIFNSTVLTPVELPEAKLRLFGAAYTSDSFDGRILEEFNAPEDDFVNIIILHSHLNAPEKYCPVTVDDIANCGADYIALGHIHKPSELTKAGNTYYAYPGTPEPHGVDDTGFYIGEIGKGYAELEHRRISDIRYRELTVDIEKTPDISMFLPSPSTHEHLRLTLTGECEAINTDSLYIELSPQYDELIIIDKTTEPRDIWEGLGEETLRGIFLRKMKERLDLCEDEHERQKILLAAKLGIDAIENRDI